MFIRIENILPSNIEEITFGGAITIERAIKKRSKELIPKLKQSRLRAIA